MKRTILAAAMFAVSLTVSAEATVEVDKFTGKSKITAVSMNLRDGEWSIFLMKAEGGTPSGGLMMLSITNSSWRYLRCNHLNFLLDGKPYPLEHKHEGEVGSTSVAEHFLIPMTLVQVAKIASAKTIEYRVCNDEFRFSQPQIDVFRDYAQAIRHASRTK